MSHRDSMDQKTSQQGMGEALRGWLQPYLGHWNKGVSGPGPIPERPDWSIFLPFQPSHALIRAIPCHPSTQHTHQCCPPLLRVSRLGPLCFPTPWYIRIGAALPCPPPHVQIRTTSPPPWPDGSRSCCRTSAAGLGPIGWMQPTEGPGTAHLACRARWLGTTALECYCKCFFSLSSLIGGWFVIACEDLVVGRKTHLHCMISLASKKKICIVGNTSFNSLSFMEFNGLY